MQESFNIKSTSFTYDVIIGSGMLSRTIESKPNAIYLADDFLANSLAVSSNQIIKIHASEDAKSLEQMAIIIGKLKDFGANRESHLVAIGGGVVQDIATFAASIYMRGIDWTYMPTTLLGMTDSCIGGKSSINVLGNKNLIGNFYPPKQILVDLEFTKTLNKDMILGGLFEACKICFARDHELFNAYLSENPNPNISLANLHRIIVMALKAKKWFIETDEFDQKERLLLNFGHTFGHALESGTGFSISHGIAVGIGMIVAIEYARAQDWLNSDGINLTDRLVSHVVNMIGTDNISSIIPPRTTVINNIISKFENDKKHLSSAYRIVCPRHDGRLELCQIPKTKQSLADVTRAFKCTLSRLRLGAKPDF